MELQRIINLLLKKLKWINFYIIKLFLNKLIFLSLSRYAHIEADLFLPMLTELLLNTVWFNIDTIWIYIDTLWIYMHTLWIYMHTLWIYIDTLWIYIDTLWIYIDTLWIYIDTLWFTYCIYRVCEKFCYLCLKACIYIVIDF